MKKLTLACVGCGSRGRTYLKLAAELGQFEIVGGADPVKERVEFVRKLSGNEKFKSFTWANELLSQEKFADVLLVTTQDANHFESCMMALEKGYDILVEKPIAVNSREVLAIERRAEELGRRVMVCHVLRYTPFYRKVKEIVNSGELGEIISINMSEGVGTFHHGHSYVRGHWAVTEKATPMIIAKSCHDLDILCWILGSECLKISSFGDLSYFKKSNKPDGAPLRCVEGCPIGDSCSYNAELYKSTQKGWLRHVWPLYNVEAPPSEQEINEWLKISPWGRCVYQCDNTAVDHQVVNMEFANKVTATFTMTAFDYGRNIEIYGTKKVLRGGETIKSLSNNEIMIREHSTGKVENISTKILQGGYEGHGGGDQGLVRDLYSEMTCSNKDEMLTSISVSTQSHIMGFAAEEARKSGRVLELREYRNFFNL
jgi:predicted dehydrogenase